MNKWMFRRQRQPTFSAKYIPQPVSQTVEEIALPVGRGRVFATSANGDLIFATCIEILAKKLAQTKWSVYGTDNKEVGYLAAAFNSTINLQPYYGINAYDFWEFMEKQRLGYGNAFAYICGKGGACRLVPLDAAFVTMYWDDANILDGNRKIWYQYDIPDAVSRGTPKTVTIPAEDMLHFKAFSANGLLGRRAVDVLKQTLASNAEIESVMRSTVMNGYAGTILLSYTSDLSQSKRKELVQQVKELLGGANNTIVPLPAGVTAQNINNDVKAYHELLRGTNAETISAFFGIPLAMLNKGGGAGMATFSTNQMTQFYNGTIAPIIKQYANEMTIKLLSPKQVNRGFRFDLANDCFDFLDAESKAKVLGSYVQNGILTANEARESLLYPISFDESADKLIRLGTGGTIGDNAGKNGGGANNKGGH